jgi:hypothetical protein
MRIAGAVDVIIAEKTRGGNKKISPRRAAAKVGVQASACAGEQAKA